jgi:signal transduction histidine kinase
MAELSDGLLSMARRLSDQTEQMAVFATHVSHELKSPLTSIQGAAELIRDAKMTEAERKKFLDNVIDDTERLTLLLKRLNELAKARGAMPDGGQTTLDNALQHMEKRLRDAMVIHGDTKANIGMSSNNLAAILGNLSGNALAHGATRVDVTARCKDNTVEATIEDNGSGIAAANASRIFDPFFTTRRDEGGTGMGLGIVRALTEAHGGTIEHVPTAHGACFRLVLPLARD